jgi:glycosyltransferase involved in cell wall biosynthesis
MSRAPRLLPLDDRGPLRVMFLITSMPQGTTETLLVNLVRRMDRDRFWPSLCCMKQLGPLGESLAREIPTFYDLIRHKLDVGVLPRLARLLHAQHVDALVTVGGGDTMFWGRLAARTARVPVVLSAIDSTGCSDVIGPLNRMRLLTRWTDGFIGVAALHAAQLRDQENFPANKVHVIPHGVDVARFHPARSGAIRKELGLAASAPLAGTIAALRPEKNHELFLRAAARVREQIAGARFLVVGEGPRRELLVQLASELGLNDAVYFLGNRTDIPEILAALNVFVLTSKIEASPVSILEAMASGKPVIATRVGSIPDMVVDGETGFSTDVDDLDQVCDRLSALLADPALARRLGEAGRGSALDNWSLERMVAGYEGLIEAIYTNKCRADRTNSPGPATAYSESMLPTGP